MDVVSQLYSAVHWQIRYAGPDLSLGCVDWSLGRKNVQRAKNKKTRAAKK